MTPTADRPGRRAIARWLATAAACVCATALAAQDWRRDGLSAFDETWQAIRDSHYDPTFNGVDWAAVRSELRPRAEQAETPDGVRRVIRDMLARLGQSHFVLLTSSPVGRPLPGDAMAPIDVRVLAGDVVVTRVDGLHPGDAAHPRPGDRVVRIGGEDVGHWLASAEGPDDRARRLDAWQRVFRALHGRPGSTVDLTLEAPDGAARRAAVTRVPKAGTPVVLGQLPALHVSFDAFDVRTPAARRVGVIGFSAWMTAMSEPFARAVDAFREADGVVIDLRGNPGGLADMLRGVAGHFLPTPALLGRMHMRGAVLEFRANPRRSTSDGRRVEPYAGPLAILVDELTGSASECFAGALQSLGRARLFGTTTMGQALPASTRALANGDVLMYAVGDFVTSNGRRLEGAGVVPDVVAIPSRQSLAEGRDVVRDAALAWIDAAADGAPGPDAGASRGR